MTQRVDNKRKESSLNSEKKPLVVFTLIVKNESHCILRCLESCLKAFKPEETDIAFAIVDTGSHDSTVDIVKSWLKSKNLKGGIVSSRIAQFRFDSARNESFCYAEYVAGNILLERRTKKKIPIIGSTTASESKGTTGETKGTTSDSKGAASELKSIFINGDDMFKMNVTGIRNRGYDFASYERASFPRRLFKKENAYIFVMDADNYVEDWEKVLQNIVVHRSQKEKFSADAYMATMEEGNNDVPRGIMFRINNQKQFRWKFMIHENCESSSSDIKHGGTITEFKVVSTREGGRSADPNKYLRDALLCEEGILESENEIEKSRYIFYAAQSYNCAGHKETAIKYYRRRLKIEHFEEERYIAAKSIAYLSDDYWMKIKYNEKAMSICPFRYEAAYELLKLYENQGMVTLAYERFRYLIYQHHNGFLFNENQIIHGHFLMKITLMADSVRKTYWKNTYRFLEVLYDQKYAMMRVLGDKLVPKYNPDNVRDAKTNIDYFDAEIIRVEKEHLERGGHLPPRPWNETNALLA